MDDILRPFISKCVIVYQDDILIFSQSWEEYVKQLRHSPTTSTISKHGQMLICNDQHQMFGYVIDSAGIHVDPKKVQILKYWPIPQNIHELIIFLGLVNCYRWIILGFSHIAWNLNQLTKGNHKTVFKWTPTQQQAF